MVVKLVDDLAKVAVVKKIRAWRDHGVSLRAILEHVEQLGFAISSDAIRRLNNDVPVPRRSSSAGDVGSGRVKKMRGA
jgi:hypothetical protein